MVAPQLDRTDGDGDAAAGEGDQDGPGDRADDPGGLHALQELTWHRTWVDDRHVQYADGGNGLPVVFLHGWALGHRAYKSTIARLIELGCRVVAPSLPGFGGTADLPSRHFSMRGYGDWVAAFLDAVGISEPVFAVGHSFGGGVAIEFAHQHPNRIRSLVLVNSIGGSAWKAGSITRSMAERPLWDWGLHFPADVWPVPQATKVLPVMVQDLVPNLLHNPLSLWRVAGLARNADLTSQLEELKRRKLPVVVLWGIHDAIIPRESFDALCLALGTQGEVVEGGHSWLLADPDAFGEVITNHLKVAELARDLEAQRPARRRGSLWRSRLRRRRTLERLDSHRPSARQS